MITPNYVTWGSPDFKINQSQLEVELMKLMSISTWCLHVLTIYPFCLVNPPTHSPQAAMFLAMSGITKDLSLALRLRSSETWLNHVKPTNMWISSTKMGIEWGLIKPKNMSIYHELGICQTKIWIFPTKMLTLRTTND